jgi:hypothetical protein
MLDVCFDLDDYQNQKLRQPSEGRAAEMFLAVGSKRESVPPVQGTE